MGTFGLYRFTSVHFRFWLNATESRAVATRRLFFSAPKGMRSDTIEQLSKSLLENSSGNLRITLVDLFDVECIT